MQVGSFPFISDSSSSHYQVVLYNHDSYKTFVPVFKLKNEILQKLVIPWNFYFGKTPEIAISNTEMVLLWVNEEHSSLKKLTWSSCCRGEWWSTGNDFLCSKYVDNSGLQVVQNDNKLYQKGKTNALATRKGFIVHTTILLSQQNLFCLVPPCLPSLSPHQPAGCLPFCRIHLKVRMIFLWIGVLN